MASLRRLSPLALFGGIVLVLWAPGCGKQGEGERCDYLRNGHQDCESPLICVQAGELVDDSQNAPDRCCPPEGQPYSDERCTRRSDIGIGGTGGGTNDGGNDASGDAGASGASGAAGGGGTSGAAGSSGNGGTGGADSGVECLYDSDCRTPPNLSCGPTGKCQPECKTAKDCDDGETCTGGVCGPADAGGD
jgi:hypothetical protein